MNGCRILRGRSDTHECGCVGVCKCAHVRTDIRALLASGGCQTADHRRQRFSQVLATSVCPQVVAKWPIVGGDTTPRRALKFPRSHRGTDREELLDVIVEVLWNVAKPPDQQQQLRTYVRTYVHCTAHVRTYARAFAHVYTGVRARVRSSICVCTCFDTIGRL